MILEETIFIKSHLKNRNYYKNKGYQVSDKPNVKFLVKVADLMPSAHCIVHISCDNCSVVIQKEYCVIRNKKIHHCGKCAKTKVGQLRRKYPKGDQEYNCELCNVKFIASNTRIHLRLLHAKNKQILCYKCDRKLVMQTAKSFSPNPPSGPANPNYNPHKSDWLLYRGRVSYFTEKNYKQYINEINPNKYPRTLCGVEGGYQLDHIISIMEGFAKGVLPNIIGSKENLQMLTWEENNKKRVVDYNNLNKNKTTRS